MFDIIYDLLSVIMITRLLVDLHRLFQAFLLDTPDLGIIFRSSQLFLKPGTSTAGGLVEGGVEVFDQLVHSGVGGPQTQSESIMV